VRLFRLQEPPWDHWLLVRRSIADPEDLAYFVVFGPATARLVDLARVAGRRWLVEECFETAKQEVGLADYEVRSWHGWHRHVTLAMLALALLAGLRATLNAAKGGDEPPLASPSCAPQRARDPPPDRPPRARPGPADTGLRAGLVLLATGAPSRRPGVPLRPPDQARAASTVGLM
jgi:hypothetical protein